MALAWHDVAAEVAAMAMVCEGSVGLGVALELAQNARHEEVIRLQSLQAKFIAALVRGDGLSMAARAEMVKPSLHIGTAHQFPNFAPYLPKAEQRSDLAAGLGMIVAAVMNRGPRGATFVRYWRYF